MATASMTNRNLAKPLMLVFFVALCFAAAGIGAWLTDSSVNTWYQTINKPTWNPPDWVFGPVWTVLYAMMGIAAWLAWLRPAPPTALQTWTPFGVQLALNTAWSGIFFGLRQPGWALAEMIPLWLAIAATIYVFRQRSRTAAWLLVPYLAWVTFALVLNFELWRLNR